MQGNCNQVGMNSDDNLGVTEFCRYIIMSEEKNKRLRQRGFVI